MNSTFQAVFDGEVLRPTSEVALRPDTTYTVSIHEPATPEPDAWAELDALVGTVEAPHDWSAEHDHYLYGTRRFRRNSTMRTRKEGRLAIEKARLSRILDEEYSG